MTTRQGIGTTRKIDAYFSTRVPATPRHVTSIMPVQFAKDATQPTHVTSSKEEGYGRDRAAGGNTHTKSVARTLGRVLELIGSDLEV